MNSPIRVLIADQDTTMAHRLRQYLTDSGFNVRVLTSGSQVAKTISQWSPDFLLIDLMLPDFSAHQCLKHLNSKSLIEQDKINVIILSHHNAKSNVEQCLLAGANDYLVKPIKFVDVLGRLCLQAQAKRKTLDHKNIENEQVKLSHYFMQLSELMLKGAHQSKDSQNAIFQLLKMLALATDAVRISVIKPSLEDENSAKVIASSDDENFKHFDLDLNKYPEVSYVFRTKKPLFIENIAGDDSTAFIKELTKSIKFNSMMVLPLQLDKDNLAVLSLRMPDSKTNFDDLEVRLAKITSLIICLISQNLDSPLNLAKTPIKIPA